MTWSAGNLPGELVQILDERAGKVHSRQGSVRTALAEILNAYDRLFLVPALESSQRDRETALQLTARLIDSAQTIYGLVHGSADA